MKSRRSQRAYEEKMINSAQNTLKATKHLARVLINEHGLEFEDCYRFEVMVGGLPIERMYHLLFDFKNTRYTSTKMKFIYRDLTLGILKVQNSVGDF